MTLGEKLKQARQAAGLSQRQLCGDTITRNMLSQIENGSARPSMDTLRVFALRLGKPISWFLEENTVTSPNRQRMQEARQAWMAERYDGVLGALEAYEGPDDTFDGEKNLLLYLSLVALARQSVSRGKDVYARMLLEQAREAAAGTPYVTEALADQWSLAMWEADPSRAQALAAQMTADDRPVLLQATAALEAGQPQRAWEILAAVRTESPRWQLLRGRAAMALADHSAAVQYLRAAEAEYPEAAFDLEVCYRELGDYKMAYQYACKTRNS